MALPGSSGAPEAESGAPGEGDPGPADPERSPGGRRRPARFAAAAHQRLANQRLLTGVLVYLFLPSLVALAVAPLLGADLTDAVEVDQGRGPVVLAAAAQIIGHGVFVWLALRLGQTLRFGCMAPWLGPALWVVAAVPWMMFVAGYTELMQRLGREVPVQEALLVVQESAPGSFAFVTMVLAAVVVAPLAEELLFRGLLFDALRARGHLVAGGLSSAIFGLLHGVEIALPLAMLGGLFYWLRVRSGGLAAPVLAHACHNGVTLLLAIWAPELFDL